MLNETNETIEKSKAFEAEEEQEEEQAEGEQEEEEQAARDGAGPERRAGVRGGVDDDISGSSI